MNKLVKGSIAGAAGIALLLGGAGTLALWNADIDIDPGTVTSGTLSVAAVGTPGWWDASPENTPAVAISNISSFKTVPGDVLTFIGNYTINATGDNLDATVTTNIASITQGISGATAAAIVQVGGVTVADGVPVNLASGDTAVNVVVTVTFASGTSGDTGQNQSIDFDALELEVQQVRPVVPSP